MAAWSEAHVRRALWRAGFGPTPHDTRKWTHAGRAATLRWLLTPDGRKAPLTGPRPIALDPVNRYGDDVLWWLDRMVRTTRPLEERMTLFWHDHFATNGQDTPLMLRQNALFRRRALGAFPTLLGEILEDPAVAGFLNVLGSYKGDPNENFARELMELFTLGEGDGYTERDVREAARALTGYVNGREVGGVLTSVRFEPENHDTGVKTIFGHRGAFRPHDVLRLCVEHPAHAPFLVRKLWAAFTDQPLPSPVRRRLEGLYVGSGRHVKPVVAAILAEPAIYADLDAPSMVKQPAVFVAGVLRAAGLGVQIRDWVYLMSEMGQTLFAPPSVAGWDGGPAWMSSSAMHARFTFANVVLNQPGVKVADRATPLGRSSSEQLAHALGALGEPQIAPQTRGTLLHLAHRYHGMVAHDWEAQNAADMTQRAMRHLLISGPDAQLH